jgi:hypothetical protein
MNQLMTISADFRMLYCFKIHVADKQLVGLALNELRSYLKKK